MLRLDLPRSARGFFAFAAALVWCAGATTATAAADVISATGSPVNVAGAWSAPASLPTVLQPPGAVSQLYPDGAGGVTAVLSDGTTSSVADRPAGGQWSTPVPVPDAIGYAGACLAANRRGDLVAVWGDGRDLFSTYRPHGAAWQPKVTLSWGNIVKTGMSCVLEDNGDAHASYQRSDGVYVSDLTAGSWTTPLKVLGSWDKAPRMAADAAGNITLAAVSTYSSTQAIHIMRKPAGQPWQTNALTAINAGGSGTSNVTLSGLVSNAAGQTVIGWGRSTGSTHIGQITSTDAFDSGSWSTTVLVSTDAPVTPDVALDDTGTVAAAWAGHAPGAAVGFTRVQAAAGPLDGSLDQTLLMTVTTAAAYPRIAVAGGAATVTFNRPLDNAILAAARPAGGPWNAPAPIAPAGSGAASGMISVLTASPDGAAVAAWARSTTSSSSLSIYDATAPELTASASEGSTLTTTPVRFDADATDDWGPVTVSWDFADGQTATGAHVTHAFSAPGSYPVVVTAHDTAGNATRASLTVTVSTPPPQGTTSTPAPIPSPSPDVSPSPSPDLTPIPGKPSTPKPGASSKPRLTSSATLKVRRGSAPVTVASPTKVTVTITIKQRGKTIVVAKGSGTHVVKAKLTAQGRKLVSKAGRRGLGVTVTAKNSAGVTARPARLRS